MTLDSEKTAQIGFEEKARARVCSKPLQLITVDNSELQLKLPVITVNDMCYLSLNTSYNMLLYLFVTTTAKCITYCHI